MRFKSLLETISGVRSVLDYRAQRGKYDFAVRPVMDDAVLAKAVSSLDASDLLVTAMDAPSGESESHPPAVLVRLDPKTANSPQSEGAFHANPNSGTRR